MLHFCYFLREGWFKRAGLKGSFFVAELWEKSRLQDEHQDQIQLATSQEAADVLYMTATVRPHCVIQRERMKEKKN